MNDGPQVLTVILCVSVHVDRNFTVFFSFGRSIDTVSMAEGTSITRVQIPYKFRSFP